MGAVTVPSLPISRSQLDKLGDRLRDNDPPDPTDLELLDRVLTTYDRALQAVSHQLRDLGFAPTARVKSADTLLDKLRRHTSSRLKTVQDLAGARIVISGTITDQDTARDTIVRAFTSSASVPRVDDRRVVLARATGLSM
jgi:hypothetical protein